VWEAVLRTHTHACPYRLKHSSCSSGKGEMGIGKALGFSGLEGISGLEPFIERALCQSGTGKVTSNQGWNHLEVFFSILKPDTTPSSAVLYILVFTRYSRGKG